MKFHLILICLLLGACSSLPSAIKDAHVVDISYNQVITDINNYKDTPVRWGGVIVEVENEENFSLLQVLFYPLDYFGRPLLNKPSEGRFVIKHSGFMDPKIYDEYRRITAVGVIDGGIELMIGKKRILVPRITSTAIHLWPIKYQGSYYDGCRRCYYRDFFW